MSRFGRASVDDGDMEPSPHVSDIEKRASEEKPAHENIERVSNTPSDEQLQPEAKVRIQTPSSEKLHLTRLAVRDLGLIGKPMLSRAFS